MSFTSLLFPGSIHVSSDRPLEACLADWIDRDRKLILGPSTRISPTKISPSTKLIFRKNPIDGKIDFLGSTSSEFCYTELADFVYQPFSETEHIVGVNISNQKHPVVYDKQPGTGDRSTYEEGNSLVAVVRYSDSEIPAEPTEKSLKTPIDQTLLDHMQELFARRAVWQRASLEEALQTPGITAKFTNALRRCSYLFLDGPWRKCYVRFGYDPRTDLGAKVWQVIDFRDPYLASSDERAKEDFKDVHFRRPPTNRSQLYQLCDIEDPGIQHVVGVSTETMCTARSGWLSESQLDSVRNQMKIRADCMRRQ